jgi:hypothetical protein
MVNLVTAALTMSCKEYLFSICEHSIPTFCIDIIGEMDSLFETPDSSNEDGTLI